MWLPGDGKANPTDITQALAKGARKGGVRIFEKTRVTSIDTKDGRVTGVQTTEGPITAEIVVNCGGQWARQVGRMVGVTVPLYSCEHMYIVTEKMENVPRDLPVMRDPAVISTSRKRSAASCWRFGPMPSLNNGISPTTSSSHAPTMAISRSEDTR